MLTKSKRNIPTFIFFCLIVATQVYCAKTEESRLKASLDDAINHSLVSYWYLGNKYGFNYIQERWALTNETKIYKVSDKKVMIEHVLQYTENQAKWINLKIWDIEFK